MTITASSTFTEIHLSRDGTENIQISYYSPDGNGNIVKALSTPDDTTLAILQEVYDSDSAFGSATIHLGNYPPQVESLVDLEPNGFPNPFIAGFFDRWVAQRKAVGAFGLEEAEVTEDTTSGRTDINFPGGMVAKRRTPSTGEMKLDLRDLAMRPDLTNPDVAAWIVYEAPVGAYYPSASPGKLAPMRALLSWLESIRSSADDDPAYSGGVVNLTPVSGAELFAAMTSRKYSLNFHGLIYDFVIDSTAQYTNSTTVEFRTGTVDGITAVLDLREFFSAMMNADEQTITVDADVEYPPANLPDAPLRGSSVRYDDDLILRHKNLFPTIAGKDAANDWYEVPLGYGRVVALQSLSTFNGKQRLGGFYGIGAVHMDKTYTADETLILPDPSVFLQMWGAEWVLTIHNQNETYSLHVEDFDQDLIATLLPREILSLRFAYDAAGEQEITNAAKFDRVVRYSHTPDLTGIVVTTEDYFTYDTDNNMRLIPLGETPLKINAEAFTIGGSVTFDEGDDINDFSDYRFEHSVEVHQDGRLRLDVEIGARTQGGSGNISTGHGLAVLHQRGQNDPTELSFGRQASMGAFENETWFSYIERDVIAGDIILFGFVYSNSASYNMDNMRYSNIRFEMTLEQTIRVTP